MGLVDVTLARTVVRTSWGWLVAACPLDGLLSYGCPYICLLRRDRCLRSRVGRFDPFDRPALLPALRYSRSSRPIWFASQRSSACCA